MLYLTKTLKRIACALLLAGTAQAMNVSRLYDPPLKPEFHSDTCFQFAALAEGSTHTHVYNEEGCLVNPFRMWTPGQNALTMLYGFGQNSAIGQRCIRVDAHNEGSRGHLLFDGNLTLKYNVDFEARWFFSNDFSIAAYLPYRCMELSCVSWKDKTEKITASDDRVRRYVTNDLVATMKELDPCFDLRGWKRSGFGDLVTMLEFSRHYPQAKPMLRDVLVDARLGLLFPSGLKQDENKLLAVPFGTNGSVGLIYGAGLEVSLGYYFKTGFDVQLLSLFDTERVRRIKTDVAQTELLLLAKTCATLDPGLTQQFNLFVKLGDFCKGFSCMVDYQFVRHDEDELCISSNDFSNEIANTALNLQEWTMHNAIFKATYDFAHLMREDARATPSITLFAKTPFNGKKSILFTTVGGIFTVEF